MNVQIKENLKEKTAKSLSVLREKLSTVRAGRANAAILDKVVVEYYGTMTSIKALANISVPDPRTVMVLPFDPKSIPEIEKAINIANLGLSPGNDGKVIRLGVPEVTEERRKELTKTIKKMGEEDKVAIRNLRRDANDGLKKLEKKGEISEDELTVDEKEVQKIVDQAIKDIDDLVAKKEKDIMEV